MHIIFFFSVFYFNRNNSKQEIAGNEDLIYTDALSIIQSKFIFFSVSTFTNHRQFHNKKGRLTKAIEYLINNQVIYQASSKNQFIKGTHGSYTMATPSQIKKNKLSIEALSKLNLNIDDYQKLWQECILPTPEMAAKIEKSAIEHINMNLYDYITIIHRLGDVNDPVAQEILKPGLRNYQIGINLKLNTFSLLPEHILDFNNDDDIIEHLNKLCIRAADQKNDLLQHGGSSMADDHVSINITDTIIMNLPQPDMMIMSSRMNDEIEQLQTKLSSIISIDIISSENDGTNIFNKQTVSNEESKLLFILNILSLIISMNFY